MSANIQYLKALPSVSDFQKLRDSTNWGELDDQMVREGIHNSIHAVCAYDNDQIVGCGRIIGDRSLYFYIQDLIVLPSYQGLDIGSVIMRELLSYLKENANPNAFVGLIAAKGVKEFYKPFGFKERGPEFPGMYLYCREL